MVPWFVVVVGCYIIAQMLDIVWRTPPAPRGARLWAMLTVVVTVAVALYYLSEATLGRLR